MADNLQNLQNLQRQVGQTWGQAFEGVNKTSQEFHDLVVEFVEFVGDWKEFSDKQRDDFLELIENLDSVQGGWKTINDWVTKNSTTLGTYVGSLSDIRNLFQSITAEAVSLRRRTSDNVNIARKLANLATENLAALKEEGGLTDKVVRNLTKKSNKIQEEYRARLQLLGVDKNESNLPLILIQEKQRLELTRSRLSRLENIKAETGRLSSVELEQLKYLRDQERLQLTNIELLDEQNRLASQGLDERIKKQEKYFLAQRQGIQSNVREKDAGENAFSFRKVDWVSSLLKKLKFSEEAQDLEKNWNQWATRRVEAKQRTDLAKETAKTAQEREGIATVQRNRALVKSGNFSRKNRVVLRDLDKRKASTSDQLEAAEKQLEAVQIGYQHFDFNQDELKEAVKAVEKLKKELESINSSIENQKNLEKQFNRELGTSNVQLNLAKEANQAAQKEQLAAEENEKTVFSQKFELVKQLKIAFADLSGLITKIGALLGVLIWRQLLKFDEEAVKTKRVIGQWADASALANTKFVTGTEVLKTMRDLGEQFHINPVQVFSGEELGRIAQAQKLTGMSAQAAGNLGVQSKIIGKNANTYRDSIAAGANQANRLNHSAVNLSAVQNDVLTTSRAITLSYGKNTEALAKAAGSAAALGMNLQDVENISRNLMNFESSIKSEMQAQLLTGMQLNLAKAREYALNNDLNGVAQEISRQGMDAAKFSHMNYIQQENMAKALGMSREQMSKMLIMQEINRGLTAKQVAAMTGMRKEDIEALSAQEKWQTMKQRFLESLVPLLEPVLQVTSDILKLVNPLVGLIGKIAGWVSRIISVIPENSVVLRTLWTLALGIGTVITVNWLRGLRGAALLGTRLGGIFKGIGTSIVNIGKGIGNWVKGLRGASTASQALNIAGMVRGRSGRLHSPEVVARARNIRRLQSMPAPSPAAATGTSRLGGAFSSLGKSMNTVLKGAAAIAIIAGALYIVAKAGQEFAKVEWSDLGKAGIVLVTLAGVAWAAGKLLSKAAPEILIASIALAGFGTALIPLAFALRLAAPAFNAFANVVAAAGIVIKSVFAGLGTLLENVTLEKAAALAVLGGGFAALGVGIAAGAVGLLLFPVKKFTKLTQSLSEISQTSGLSQVVSDLTQMSVALGSVAESLDKVDLQKFKRITTISTLGNLGNAIASRIAKPRENSSIPEASENSRESQGIRKETIEAAAQSIVIKQAQVQASAQQISIEQKATDLSKIEQKIDRVVKAVVESRPDWNWLEFNRAYSTNAL